MSRRLVFINRFFHPDPSATSQILSDLAFSLAESEFEVHVIASRHRRAGTMAMLPSNEVVRNVSIHRIATPDFHRLGLLGRALEYLAFYPGAVASLLRYARSGDVIVAKTDPPLISVVCMVVARLRGARLVNWIQDLYPEVALRLGVPLLSGPVAALLIKARNAALKRAAINVAIGERMAEHIEGQGVPSEKICVIANWTDDDAIRPVARDSNMLRARLGLTRAFIVGYSGNLGRAHEFETLLGAAEMLKDEKDLAFLFIGAGHQVDALRERVRALGLDGLFHFLPPQPRADLSLSLSLPDVHWLSLRPDLEGLIVPSKFYGIAAAGRAVISITADRGEIAELVRESKCGVVVEPGQSAALAAWIKSLRADRRLCDEMGANARALVDGRFSKRRSLEAWEKLLKSLRLSGAASRTPERSP